MPRTNSFCSHVAQVIGIDRGLKRHAACDFDAGPGQTLELGGIVGQENNARAVEHLQHARGDAVVALVVVEAKRRIGINRVETVVLQLIGPHLVGEAYTAASVCKIKHDPAAEIFEPSDGKLKLVAAVAAPRTKDVAGKAR